MRLSRFTLLPKTSGIVHLFWKCHNSDFLLNLKGAKRLFFECLIFGLKHRNSDSSVKLHAFCIMGNHVHQQMSYSNGVSQLSHFMRVAHGLFGRRFNDRFKRSGKVANERPKTPLIEDETAQMRVHFYIEANPIRAGVTRLEKLREYFWSSYRFYAYGDLDQYTNHLTPPSWYLRLGQTAEDRQKAYRELFKKYLEGAVSKSKEFHQRFIGSLEWINTQKQYLRNILRKHEGMDEPHGRVGTLLDFGEVKLSLSE